jgi:hypothetical protein
MAGIALDFAGLQVWFLKRKAAGQIARLPKLTPIADFKPSVRDL